MGLLFKNSEPAERMRGAVFAERFESSADVALNEGTITGTPFSGDPSKFTGNGSSYITYRGVRERISGKVGLTFLLKNVISSATSSGATGRTLFAARSGVSPYGITVYFADSLLNVSIETAANYFTVSNSQRLGDVTVVYDGTQVGTDRVKVYFGGVLQTLAGSSGVMPAVMPVCGDNFILGAANVSGSILDSGSFGNVKIFNTALTAQEVLDYSNNSTFNYRNKASLSLPMTMANHDPTNVRTLDRSGKGRNATLGDGATPTTYPTKNSNRGYAFDGTTDYISPGLTWGSVITSTKGTIAVTIVPQGTSPVSASVYNGRSICGDVSVYAGIFKTTFGGVDKIWGNIYTGVNRTIGVSYVNGESIRLVLLWDTTISTYQIYKNGILADSLVVPSGISDTTGVFRIGRVGSPLWQGDIKDFTTYQFALTPLQVADDYLNSMKAINEN